MSPKERGIFAVTTPQYADFEANQHCMAGMGKPPADPANDVWALGLFLFELMYSEPANPFANTKLVLREHAVFEQALSELLGKLKNTPADGLIRAMLTMSRQDRAVLDEGFLALFQHEVELYRTETPRTSTIDGCPSPCPSTP